MQTVEFEELFGAKVLVQFTDPIFLAKPGKGATAPVVQASGEPHYVQARQGVSVHLREYVENDGVEEDATYHLTGIIMPASGGRVAVLQELPTGVRYIAVRPEKILAATIIHKAPGGGGLIAQA